MSAHDESKLIKIKRVLISVHQKDKLPIILEVLKKFDVEIYASDGTKKFIEDLKIIPTSNLFSISSYTKNPEILKGKVKTISYQLSASLLFDPNNQSEQEEFNKLHLHKFDMVIANLYPFNEYYQNENYNIDNVTKLTTYIDIGGMLLIRAGAKNFQNVVSVVDYDDYDLIKDSLEKNNGSLTIKDSIFLMKKAFRYTAEYELSVANAFAQIFPKGYGDNENNSDNNSDLKYGENPHQKASFYKSKQANIKCLSKNSLSYNNIVDIDSSLALINDLNYSNNLNNSNNYVSVIVKHSNPCGVASTSADQHQSKSFVKALEGDVVSSFGGVLSFNTPLEMKTLDCFSYQENGVTKNRFFEVILAPDFDLGVVDRLNSIYKNIKIVRVDKFTNPKMEVKYLTNFAGSLLIQERNSKIYNELNIVSKNKNRAIDLDSKMDAIEFGLKVVKEMKSNAIAVVKHERSGATFTIQLVGAGVGWPNRVGAVNAALENTIRERRDNDGDLILFSDGFFPFADSIELISKYKNIKTVVEPGGSIRDKDVIAKANELEIDLIFTGVRLFKH
ncbi:MAG: bifunctional phosphoribosylaminoimidazolecarboxamide formyltransferase/IMP cyclohydrolase [Oligoflexia bacterium]|nr:bifunctional phosphoribosylaminoimidazolecarboxamide formyltransferase/IMP cyclohydrolase [Oligoflexia bacterium]